MYHAPIAASSKLMKGAPAKPSIVRTVDRALTILELFGGPGQEWTYSQISRATGINRTIVYRLLATLGSRGFVERDPETRAYRLGRSMLDLSQPGFDTAPLKQLAAPELQRLANETQESVWLYARRGHEVVVIEQVEVGHKVQASYPLGSRLRLLGRGATTRVFLAFMPEDQARSILDSRFDISVAEVNRIEAELTDIRAKGYAEAEAVPEGDLAVVSAPIVGLHGFAVAALTIAAPRTRLTGPIRARIAPSVAAAAQRISRGLAEFEP